MAELKKKIQGETSLQQDYIDLSNSRPRESLYESRHGILRPVAKVCVKKVVKKSLMKWLPSILSVPVIVIGFYIYTQL